MIRFLKTIMADFPELANARTLLAVSGGMDSIFLAHLFQSAGWSFGIAHCNFQLRGRDSEEDLKFIETLAGRMEAPFYTVSFETEKVARETGVSIQMAARELRYPWLEELRREKGYDWIATAHHLNDSIETSLINQTRGTGLRGLTGIPVRQDRLIRPLTPFTRKELADYVSEHGIIYREDSSNLKDEYHRNRIRHHVIPVLRSINPALEATFQQNLEIWSQAGYLVEWASAAIGRQYVSRDGDRLQIEAGFIAHHAPAALSLLYEWLKDYGFHSDQLRQALDRIKHEPGGVWYSATHRLLADRHAFIVEPRTGPADIAERYRLENAGQLELPDGSRLKCIIVDKEDGISLSESEDVAHLDADKVSFPLIIRHWQNGDVFYPLGMHGHRKKLQDYFSDKKINRFDKEKIWVVEAANGDLIWIAGHRLDERYKIGPSTSRILNFQFDPVR